MNKKISILLLLTVTSCSMFACMKKTTESIKTEIQPQSTIAEDRTAEPMKATPESPTWTEHTLYHKIIDYPLEQDDLTGVLFE